MNWLAQNWLWILLALGVLVMLGRRGHHAARGWAITATVATHRPVTLVTGTTAVVAAAPIGPSIPGGPFWQSIR